MPAAGSWWRAGLAGVAGVLCYVAAVAVPWPGTQLGTAAALLAVSAWPLLSIAFSHGLRGYVAAERDGVANQLAFVFAALAFATVLAMIIVQQAVGAGAAEMTRGVDEATATAIRRGLRLVDFGLDVAWDLLIGTALVLWGVAMARRSGLGPGWGVPCVVFGVSLVGLNLATFPWPPDTRGLFDIGPFIAVYLLALAARLAWLGRRASPPAAASTAA